MGYFRSFPPIVHSMLKLKNHSKLSYFLLILSKNKENVTFTLAAGVQNVSKKNTFKSSVDPPQFTTNGLSYADVVKFDKSNHVHVWDHMSMVTSKPNFYFQAKLVNNYMYISIKFCICLLIQDQGYLISD